MFVDRYSMNPKRRRIKLEGALGGIPAGTEFFAEVDYADNPITEGTPLNAENLNAEVNKKMSRTYLTGDSIFTFGIWINLNIPYSYKDGALYLVEVRYPSCRDSKTYPIVYTPHVDRSGSTQDLYGADVLLRMNNGTAQILINRGNRTMQEFGTFANWSIHEFF